MNKRLADRPYLAGSYSIADIASVGWPRAMSGKGRDWAEFPHLKRWFEAVTARPAVRKGMSLRVEAASNVDMRDPAVAKILFGQRARQ
jgi:GST-like protein